MPNAKAMICPFCGHAQEPGARCESCQVPVDSSTRQATLGEMGPWSVRDPLRPHFPGCSYEMMVRLVAIGVIKKHSVVRGPSTQQFWVAARRTPGIAHLLGYCHNCDSKVSPRSTSCSECLQPFEEWLDRERLGLVPAGATPNRPQTAGSDPFAALPAGHSISAFAPDREIAAPAEASEGTTPTAGTTAAGVASSVATARPSAVEITLAQELGEARVRIRVLMLLVVALGIVAVAGVSVFAAVRLLQPAAGG